MRLAMSSTASSRSNRHDYRLPGRLTLALIGAAKRAVP